MLKTYCSKIAKFVFILLVAPLFFVVQESNAQTSTTINFQGKIVRNDTGYEGLNVTTGSPACVLSGADTCDFQVKYYSASTGGTLYLTETFVNKEIGDYQGIFNLSLGSGSMTAGTYSTLDQMINGSNSIYVEILFAPGGAGSYTETFTRMPLQATPFAIRSKYAEMAKGAFKFENAANSTGYTGSNGMVYYDTTDSTLKLYSGGTWTPIATGGSSIWQSASITSYSHTPSQFLETTGIATLANFGIDTSVNRAWVHGASSRTGFSVYSNYEGATDWPLVTFKADASNFGNSILQLIQDGTGSVLEGYKGSDKVFDFDNRGDLHLSSDGVMYFEPFAASPTNLYPASGEGCLYNVSGSLYWDATCNYNGVALAIGNSSLWTDGGTFTYLTSTTDDIYFGGNTLGTATFIFDVDASGGNYLEIDNALNTQRLFTIDANGNVGIGTDTPTAKLDIGGTNSNIVNAMGDITITPAQNLIISQGNVGIGTTSPTSLFSVGSTSQFQVSSTGDIVKIKNLTYSWPSAHTTNGILANNGSGTLTWSTIASLGGVTGTGSGSATAGQITFWNSSTSITGDNGFWWDNTNKRLGIGTNTPQTALDIAGATSEISNTEGDIVILPEENLVLGSGNLGVGILTTYSAKVSVVGLGTTSSTTNLHLLNSAETSIFQVLDDGKITLSSGAQFSKDGTNWMPVADKTRVAVLAAEYAGAVLSADGTANVGAMTSDSEGSASNSMNYYEWNSSETTLNDYDVRVRFQLPSDFNAWGSGGVMFNYATESTSSTSNKLDFYIYREDSGTVDDSSVTKVSSSAGVWTSVTLPGSNLNICNSAGHVCVFVIRMYSANDNFSRVGDIEITYDRKL